MDNNKKTHQLQTPGKSKVAGQHPLIDSPEKHPLEEPPPPVSEILSEEELDRIHDEEADELDSPPYEPPLPAEGP